MPSLLLHLKPGTISSGSQRALREGSGGECDAEHLLCASALEVTPTSVMRVDPRNMALKKDGAVVAEGESHLPRRA